MNLWAYSVPGCDDTGDGIVSALQVVAAVVESGKSLHELKQQMSKYPQCMINVPCSRERVADSAVISASEETENALAGKGRVLLRHQHDPWFV